MTTGVPRGSDPRGSNVSVRVLVVLAVLIAATVSPAPGRPGPSADSPAIPRSDPTPDRATWVHPQPLPVPGLKGADTPVRAVSWARVSRGSTPSSGAASLVMKRSEIAPFLQTVDRSPWQLSARHEYMVRAGASWWSLHLRGRGKPGRLVRSLQDMIARTRLQSTETVQQSGGPAGWVPLASTLAGQTYRSGPFLHLHRVLHNPSSDSAVADPGGGPAHHLVFQRTGEQVVVLGDVLVPGRSFASAVGTLYDHGMIMTSIAFDSEHPRKHRFFVHFAGVGEAAELGRRIRQFLDRLDS